MREEELSPLLSPHIALLQIFPEFFYMSKMINGTL